MLFSGIPQLAMFFAYAHLPICPYLCTTSRRVSDLVQLTDALKFNVEQESNRFQPWEPTSAKASHPTDQDHLHVEASP